MSDERSGDEVTDSEKEFQEIVELDSVIKDIIEKSLEVSELHNKIQELFTKMRTLKDLIDFESSDIKDIVEGIISRELIYFTSFSGIVKLVETAYQIQLPYQTFWHGVANVVLLNYHEMELNHIVQLLYYL